MQDVEEKSAVESAASSPQQSSSVVDELRETQRVTAAEPLLLGAGYALTPGITDE